MIFMVMLQLGTEIMFQKLSVNLRVSIALEYISKTGRLVRATLVWKPRKNRTEHGEELEKLLHSNIRDVALH